HAAGREAADQAEAEDEHAQLFRPVAAAALPEQPGGRNGEQHPEQVGPGADRLAEMQDVHTRPLSVPASIVSQGRAFWRTDYQSLLQTLTVWAGSPRRG